MVRPAGYVRDTPAPLEVATNFVCPINGTIPADNGTSTANANNTLALESDAVAAGSGVIGSTSGTTINVTTGSNFHVGDYIQIPTRNEWFLITGIASNTLTVTRAQRGTVASGAIALNDVVLTGVDVAGNPPHCPVCGAAMIAVDPAKVTAMTGVAAGSQHPADIDATYVTATDSALAQFGATAYTLSGQRSPVMPHKYSTTGGNVTRGTSTVTPETVNTVAGP